MMNNKSRFKLPIARLDPDYCVLTYVLQDKRVSLPLTSANLEKTAEIWTTDMVETWFAKDLSKMFYYVPQIAVYQPQGIAVNREDVEEFTK
jgi:hypothetical protein